MYPWHKEPRAASNSSESLLELPSPVDLRDRPEGRASGTAESTSSPALPKCLKGINTPNHLQANKARHWAHTLTCRIHWWSCLTPLWWELSSAWLLLPLELPARQRLQWSLVNLARWKQSSSDLEDGSENILILSMVRCALQKNHHLGGFNLKERNHGKENHKKKKLYMHLKYPQFTGVNKCEKLRSSDSAKDQADGTKEK